MNTHSLSSIRLLLVLLSGIISSVTVSAQQITAFSYQGRLQDNGGPASGLYDLTFGLYDSTNLPGNLVTGPLTNPAVAVSNGMFTVALDFGAAAFSGPARWLEVAVRTNGSSSFTALSPRQPVLPVPYALMAGSASNLLGTLPAGQLSGTVPLGNLSSNVALLNGAVNFSGNVAAPMSRSLHWWQATLRTYRWLRGEITLMARTTFRPS